jgi:hypothetical protein
MGIRAFLDASPPGPEFARRMRAAQAQAAALGRSRSPVGVLAAAFLAEGAAGLQAGSGKLGAGGVALPPDAIGLGRVPPGDRAALAADLGAVLLGAVLLALEEALVERAVDLGLLRARINEALTGTPFPPLAGPGDERRALGDDEWAAMLRHAAADKTLAVFFGGLGEALPGALREYVRALPFFPSAVALLPAYGERARLLVGDAAPGRDPSTGG